MKIMLCWSCNDLLALRMEERTCACGQSKGKYITLNDAEITGPSMVLAVRNDEYMRMFSKLPNIDGAVPIRVEKHEHMVDVGVKLYYYDVDHPKSAVKKIG